MKAIAFKLVLRSWWRNKTFSVISIGSLSIGIACANLLTAYVIHEYNLENDNPARTRIYTMDQDSPMKVGEQVASMPSGTAFQLKEKYPEVEDVLQINRSNMKNITIGNKKYKPVKLLTVSPSFLHFFPYEAAGGNLGDVLAHPGKIAITSGLAARYFGKENPVGKTLSAVIPGSFGMPDETETYQVAAVLKERSQTLLDLDAFKLNPEQYSGGYTLLMTKAPIDIRAFSDKLKKDKVDTFLPDSRIYLYPMKEGRNKEYNTETIDFVNRGNETLLYVSLLSAVLILLIACFNYINLNFSRLLQQVRMIHTEKLMGATAGEVSKQLFTDTFLTVIAAFLLSLLIIHDLTPVFNSVVSGRLHTSFFFNLQVLPVLVCFLLLLSVVPAIYMSRKVSRLNISGYRDFFTGKKKRRIVSILSIVQYSISIGLIIAALTVDSQLNYVKRSGERYRNLIEIGDYFSDYHIPELIAELRKQPAIEYVTPSAGSMIHFSLAPLKMKHEDGTEKEYMHAQYMGGTDFLEALRIRILRGLTAEDAAARYERPLYVSRKYAEMMFPKGENPVGQPITKYEKSFADMKATSNVPPIIAGITEDIFTGSLAEDIFPSVIYIDKEQEKKAAYVEIRLRPGHPEALSVVQNAWKKVNPDQYFTYTNVYDTYMRYNSKVTELSKLLLIFSLISIFLTCFGLFGMALYAAGQRTKEIGIRKVNGAGTFRIIVLLNRQFICWIGIAFAIAAPIAYLWLNHWLEGFLYRVPVSSLSFLLAGIIVIAITLLTVSYHSYRAASGNPVDSLRAE